MAGDSVWGDDETGDRGLGEIPQDINFGPFQGQVPLKSLPEFLGAASAGRNMPTAQSVAGASINSHSSAAVFGRSTRCTLNQIIQDEVIV